MGLPAAERARSRPGAGLLATLVAATALVGGVVACGDEDDGPAQGSVAVVGDEEIGQRELSGQVAALRRAQRGTARRQRRAAQAGEPGGAAPQQAVDAKALRQQALSTLLIASAIEQEADDRGIAVTRREVRDRWEGAIGAQFRNAKQLRRFLGGRSEQDVLDQLRLQLLTERIHEQVSEQAGGGKRGASAVAEFQREFQQRWRERTDCSADAARQASALCAED